MDDTWKALKRDLLARATSRTAGRQFEALRARASELAEFGEPAALLAYFDSKEDLDRKDRIYAALVDAAHRDGEAELSLALIFLGLFPGLDAAHKRAARKRDVEPDELVSVFWAAFADAVLSARLGRISRVAATVVLNTQRTVRRTFCSYGAHARASEPLPEEDEFVDQRSLHPADSEFGLPEGLSLDGEVRVLRRILFEIVGRDADLIIAKVVCEETNHAIGEHLGISGSACHRRYYRALQRTRIHLQTAAGATSTQPPRSTAPRAPQGDASPELRVA